MKALAPLILCLLNFPNALKGEVTYSCHNDARNYNMRFCCVLQLLRVIAPVICMFIRRDRVSVWACDDSASANRDGDISLVYIICTFNLSILLNEYDFIEMSISSDRHIREREIHLH